MPRYDINFHKRTLPSQCISLSSTEGQEIFRSAQGCPDRPGSKCGLKVFFDLVTNFRTQVEPAYCGPSTLVMVLNTLAIKPRDAWGNHCRGTWREDSMMAQFNMDVDEVKEVGITFSTFVNLAKFQRVQVDEVYGSESTVEEFRSIVRKVCCNAFEDYSTSSLSFSSDNSLSEQSVPDQLKKYLVVSYFRQTLGQTGTGHFSPIGAYDEELDQVLILDTARFKYSPHWVSLDLLFEAMLPLDPDSNKSRGYMLIWRNK